MGIAGLNPLSTLNALAGDLASLLYPPRCRGCDGESDGFLCPACDAALAELIDHAACPRCARPIASAGTPCVWCRGAGMGRIRSAARLAAYETPLPQLLHRAKFQHRWEIAELLADRLAKQPATIQLLQSADVLVPVPLSYWRQVFRGYNPAMAIARRLSKASGVPLVCAVVRVRRTRPQSLLKSRAARERNVRDAFATVRPGALFGKRVAIVDDITTTGATLAAMARAIRVARPASLAAVTIAVATHGRRN